MGPRQVTRAPEPLAKAPVGLGTLPPMASNLELAGLFAEMAKLTKIADGSAQSFRARAYESAAKSLEGLAVPAADLTESELMELKGIGKASASRIREFLDTGKVEKLEELRAAFPPDFLELVRIPGLGPKTAILLRDELGVESVADLKVALENEAVRELPGLGKKTEENLVRAVERMGLTGKDRRTPILDAMIEARRLVAELEAVDGVVAVQYCGSLRRFRDTVADLDILVATDDGDPVVERLVGLASVKETIGSGETKTSVLTQSGLQVDLRIVRADQWGAATMYFTGSKDHNIRLRQLAIDKGWLLNEYGLEETETGKVVASETEEDIYDALGLPYILPTLREDRGEIEAGLAGELPDVVLDGDLRGDLHVHTDMSGDGDHPLEAMLDAAAELGLEYIAITDHAENLTINGVGKDEMLAQRERIADLQASYPTMKILHGTELNIAPDGTLDYDFDFLMGYDWCVASVHSHFDLDRETQTVRLIEAMKHPAVNVIGHLIGRRVGKRPGIEIDVDAVLTAAELTGTAIEINSHLDRLDAPVEVLWQAKDRDVRFIISTDSHRTGELKQSRWGIRQAQRGWVDKAKIANTWEADRFLEWAATSRHG